MTTFMLPAGLKQRARALADGVGANVSYVLDIALGELLHMHSCGEYAPHPTYRKCTGSKQLQAVELRADTFGELRAAARALGVPRSVLMREALDAYVAAAEAGALQVPAPMQQWL